MSLSEALEQRESSGRRIGVGLIGAGKFASMFLAQARRTPGMAVSGVCDLDLGRAERTLLRAGYSPEELSADSPIDAAKRGSVWLGDDAGALIASAGIDVVIDATGDPAAGIRHALACCEAERHIVMVNVEADVLAGPLLAERARRAGVVYSLAYGDQPALIVELIDWARTSGLEIVCAGKGTKYLPAYHRSTPETVWGHYGISAEEAAAAGMNPKMFNSFLDGTKSAIEMAAVSNASGLEPPVDGLQFPPCGSDRLADVLKPRSDGGVIERKGTVEVVSSLERDGSEVERDLRWGVYVTFEAGSDYVANCFREYGLATDSSGRYAALYRPYHLIGLELGVSVASAVLRGEPTGAPGRWNADVVAVAKRDLREGEVLDGEGGSSVWGRLTTSAASLESGALPIGLANRVALCHAVRAGAVVKSSDVALDEDADEVRVRREMERMFGKPA